MGNRGAGILRQGGAWGALVGLAVLGVSCGGRTGFFGSNVTPDPDPGCGNGVLEPDRGEDCDLDNLGGYSCTALGYPGGTLRCNASCHFVTDQCTVPQSCGDGVVDPGEECDDANRADCDGCSAQCRVEMCGNGVVECDEQCDDGNLQSGDGCNSACQTEFVCGNGQCEQWAGETCALCPDDCCPNCGNGWAQGDEECDGNDLGGQSCESLCFDSGTLQCTAECTLDTSQCTGGPVCGDGVAECDEVCDQADLRGKSCADFGFSAGLLGCTAGCVLDTSGCTGFLWYLYEDFEDPSTGGWTLTGDWEWGTPTGALGEPTQADEGTQCLGTRLGLYYSNSRAFADNLAISPPIDLSGASSPTLSYAMWLRTEECCDGGAVFVRPMGASSWTHLDTPSLSYSRQLWGQWAWTGLGFATWQQVTFDLSAWTGQVVELGFGLFTDSSVTEVGMYVDDVLVSEAAAAPIAIVTAPELGWATAGSAYSQQLSATGGSGSYTWSIEPGGFNRGWLSLDPVTGRLAGTPSMGNLGDVEVVVRAAAPTVPTNYDEQTFELAVVQAVWEQSFDSGSTGWTLSGDWEWGVPSLVGPPGCRTGSCIGTVMAGDYHSQQSWSLCTATSPPIDLSATAAPRLQFWAFVDTEGGSFDGGNLKVGTGGPSFVTLTNVQPAYNLSNVDGQWAWGGQNMSAGWQLFQADLSAYAGQIIQLRYAFRSDGNVEDAGIYVDELMILD